MVEVSYRLVIDGHMTRHTAQCFRKGEREADWKLSQFVNRIWSMKLGEYVETADEWVVPIIKSTGPYIRLACLEGKVNRYNRARVQYHKLLPIFEKGIGEWPASDNLTEQQSLFVWELANTWNLLLACKRAGYVPYTGLQLLQRKHIQEALRLSLKSMIEITGKSADKFFFDRMEKLMDTLQEGVKGNATENPEGSAKLADVLLKALTQMQNVLIKDDTKRLQSSGFVAFGQLPQAKHGYDLHKEIENAETKEISGEVSNGK